MDNEQDCTIIGCGATGSHLAWLLARLGARSLTLYDGDIVAPHNIRNQMFGIDDVGQPKVAALSHSIQCALGTSVTGVPEFVREPRQLKGPVFLCVDSMHAAKQIMHESVFQKPDVPVAFQSRMDASRCVVYAFDPNNQAHQELWVHYWFPDSQAENETHACGGTRSVCYTPFMAAALMVESYASWLGNRNGEGDLPPSMRWLDLRKNTMGAEYW